MAILLWEKGLIILPWGMGVSYIVLEDRFDYTVLVRGVRYTALREGGLAISH